MSRYRKIEVRIWSDEKFQGLSPLPPSGQSLWLYLLTGPHTGPIPGLFRASRGGLADELGWDLEAFDKAFREVFQKGMAKADWKAKLVWLPKAVIHNKPESPNVIKSWAPEFDLLPECPLKGEALTSIRASVYALSEGYRKAFDEAFPEAFEKPLAKAMPNQEQEQEVKDISPNLLTEITPLPEIAPTPPKPKPKPKASSPEQLLAEFGIDGQLAEDFAALRKRKDAPITLTALQGIAREAAKAGISNAEAVRICVERSWQGFKADWDWQSSTPEVNGNGNQDRRSPPKTRFEQHQRIGAAIDRAFEAAFAGSVDGGPVQKT